MSQLVRVIAPAKVNLFLGVGHRLPSGYHHLDAVFHPLALHDEVILSASDALSLECASDVGVPAEQNLAYRAAEALGSAVKRDPSFSITLIKRIPHGAGLGGGSSDAAAVIAGLAHVWDISPTDECCLEVAAALGADVPFFLHGGAALMGGRGDELLRSLRPRKSPVVVVRPPLPISTSEAYRAFDANPSSPGSLRAVIAAVEGDDAAALGRSLSNNFEPVAVSLVPEIGDALGWLRNRSGVLGATVAGSGSAVFGVVETDEMAHHVAAEARSLGWWAEPTRLAARGAHVADEEGPA